VIVIAITVPAIVTMHSIEFEEGLLVTLYLTFRCNFKCSYCCSLSNSKRYHQDIKLDDAFKVIDRIRDFEKPVVLTLLGGEPTLYKDLYKIINYAEAVDNIKVIELYTNGSKEIKLSPKLIPVISIHHNPKFYDIIYKNMMHIKNHKHRIKLMMDKDYDFPYDLSGFNCFAWYIEDTKKDVFNIYPKKTDIEDRKVVEYKGKMISMRNYLKYFRKDHRLCYPREIEIFPDLTAVSCCNLLNLRGTVPELLKAFEKIRQLDCDLKCTYLETEMYDLD